MLYLWLSSALAAPNIAVVGAHIPGISDDLAERVSAELVDALEARKLSVWDTSTVGDRLSGKESLVVEDMALGPGREMLQEARILYDRAQPDSAIPVAEEAVAALELSQGLGAPLRDLQDALLLLGMCYLANGDDAEATEAFERAAAKDPSRALETASYPPAVREIFSASVSRLKNQVPGHLWISASTSGVVLIDGKEVGDTPLQDLSLLPGNHVVVIKGEHGAIASTITTIVAGQTSKIDLMLERRNLGRADQSEEGRARQVRHLYQGLGRYSGADLVLLAGQIGANAVLQLYNPMTSTFSKVHSVPVSGNVLDTLTEQLAVVIGFMDENGRIRADKSSTQVAALDVSTNDVLAGLLLDPTEQTVNVTDPERSKGKIPWYVWAGIGAVVAGGGITGAAIATAPPGYITFAP